MNVCRYKIICEKYKKESMLCNVRVSKDICSNFKLFNKFTIIIHKDNKEIRL